VKRLVKKVRSILSGNKGFSLLELVVVLAIMGFLVAMIAPRLAGVVAGAGRSVDDSNMQRLATTTALFNERLGRLPSGMTNLIVEEGDEIYSIPNFSNNDPTDGKEIFSAELEEVLPLRLHYLSDDEATELRRMGVTKVRNLNPSIAMDEKYVGPESTQPHLQEVEVAEGVAVLMIGAGFDLGFGWEHDINTSDSIVDPDLFFRIVLGFGKDNELITSGQLQGSAVSPRGGNNDNYIYNNYLLVLPRLAATVNGEYDREIPIFSVDVSNENGEVKVVSLEEAQPSHNFAVVSPEGVIYPKAALWLINSIEEG
jgi:prepilin-type N-terminal cleavage/methylation domain-containing protein